MNNYGGLGLLAGLSKGLLAGLQGYRDERSYQDSRRDRDVDVSLKENALRDAREGREASVNATLVAKGSPYRYTGGKFGIDNDAMTAHNEANRAEAQKKRFGLIRAAAAKAGIDLGSDETLSTKLGDQGGKLFDPPKNSMDELTATLKGLDIAKKKKELSDPMNQLGAAEKQQAEAALKRSGALDRSLEKLAGGLEILTDPKRTDEEKYDAGQQLVKTLNDPEVSDALAAFDLKRLAAPLSIWPSMEAGKGPGRDFPRFEKNVRNVLKSIVDTQKGIAAKLGEKGISTLPLNPRALRFLTPTPKAQSQSAWTDAEQKELEELEKRFGGGGKKK